MIDHAYEKEKGESWYDARDEWIKDQLDELVRGITVKINEQPYKYEHYTYKDVIDIIKRLL